MWKQDNTENRHVLEFIKTFCDDNDFCSYLGVRITIDGEEIDSSVKYEVEL